MPFGAFLDAAMSIPRNMQMEEDRNQRQQHDWGAMVHTQNFNSAQAAIQRDWTERLSNTQYQRAAGDASAAGLNRILAMRQGGADAGGGAAASGSASGSSGSPGSASSNFNATNLNQFTRQQSILAAQQVHNVNTDTVLKSQNVDLVREQEKSQRELTKKLAAEAETAENTARGARLEGQIDETRYGEVMRHIDRLRNAISPFKLGPSR